MDFKLTLAVYGNFGYVFDFEHEYLDNVGMLQRNAGCFSFRVVISLFFHAMFSKKFKNSELEAPINCRS